EVRAKKPALTQFKGDFPTTTNGRAGGLLARTGSLSGHPSKQQPRSTLLDPVLALTVINGQGNYEGRNIIIFSIPMIDKRIKRSVPSLQQFAACLALVGYH
ncbi:hypothetical protein J6590_098384, partial [Homalodisca vitripennis]